MKLNYLKIVWRNLMKSKVFSGINILGLAIGIAVCMMILLFVITEFSYDRFHRNGDHIYRVMRSFDDNGLRRSVPSVSPPYSAALQNDYPYAIKQATRVEMSTAVITVDNEPFNEKKVLMADPNFFSFFSFKLLEGNPKTVLSDPGSVVMTVSAAKKYFGNHDPIGKVVTMDQDLSLKVTGIMEDVPVNSHLDFNMIVPLANYSNVSTFTDWTRNRLYTYVELNDGITEAQVEKNFPSFMEKYMGNAMEKMGMHFELSLTPLHDIYFEPFISDRVKHGDKNIVYIFLSVAILILLIACINFVNLSTIRALDRSKEIGVRKAMGAMKGALRWQFISESIILTTFACMLSIILVFIFLPLYNNVLDQSMTFTGAFSYILLFIPLVILVVGFLAGLYPAFFLSSFSPIASLKGRLNLGTKGVFIRQTMVVVQFSISVLLIIGTIIIMYQMSYIRHKDVGYNKEQTVILKMDNRALISGQSAFKSELNGNDNIMAVSRMSGEPGGFFDGMTFDVEGKDGLLWKASTEFSDLDYVKALGLKIVAGRDFSASFSTDTISAALINETAATELGFTPETAVGKWIKNSLRDSVRRVIVGVVRDFNYMSLKEKVSPLVIAPVKDYRVILVRIKPGHLETGVAAIREAYRRVAPGLPFEFDFLDQKFDLLYKKDLRQQTILSIFSCLAIFIACMGLFGLSSFVTTKRIKEIGIRKTLGSSVSGIVLLLAKDLLRPIVIAIFIAIPLGYIFMNYWLQNFAYRISLSWWIFLIASLFAFCIALFTVCYHTIKAAAANPISSLRSE
ncbi:ABC transporter permease [Chitinophaga sp.]|uniref:ABC transporter permease n=1 Tax=Chitinophaga sp. TaxID=1869181 RepID=UPI0031CF0701